MRHASLADELLFDSLPLDTQEAIKRLFNTNCDCEYTAEEVDNIESDAFHRGWKAAIHAGLTKGKQSIIFITSPKEDTHLSLVIKRRGRPRKVDVLARQQSTTIQPRTDVQVLSDLSERFDILSLLTKGAIAKNIRSLVVTGAPGVGKTYTVENILENSGAPHEIVRGSLSALHLYMLAYRYRRPGSVIVLDDADSIFNDEDALNILKALCDTSSTRKVSYLKEAPQLREDDIPQSFEFNGAMIFISNLDFQTFVEEGKNKYAQHFEALMSRSLYLDLRLHNRNELSVWVNHIAGDGRIFDREDVPDTLRPAILHFIATYRDNLRELSIRTLLKACQIAKQNPNNWQSIAKVLLCKSQLILIVVPYSPIGGSDGYSAHYTGG